MAPPHALQPNGTIALSDGRVPVLDPSVQPKFSAIVAKLAPLIVANAARTGLPPAWIAGIVWAETGFLGPVGGESAVSPAGAIGRMQLMPFWFTVPTAIGDGVAHSIDEMKHDPLNMRFGSDLLALIAKDGNDLPATASIYNCGSTAAAHPWHPRTMSTDARWGYCSEHSSDGTSYIDQVVAAANTYALAHPMAAQTGKTGAGRTVGLAVAVGAGVWWAGRRWGILGARA